MDSSTIPDIPPVPHDDGTSSRSTIARPKTAPGDSETARSSSRSNGRSSSIDSTSDRPKSQAGEVTTSAKAGSSGFSKLISRRRRKKKEKQAAGLPTQFELEDDDAQENRPNESRDGSSSNDQDDYNRRESTLLTDDSEIDQTPPLTSRNSYAGFYTTSSPLIKPSVAEGNDTDGIQADVESAVSGPSATRSESNPDAEPQRPISQPTSTLSVPEERGEKKRGTSPGRRLKNAFGSGPDKKSSNRSRTSSTSGDSRKGSVFGGRSRRSSLASRRAQTVIAEDPPPLPPIRTDLVEDKPNSPSDITAVPRTPPRTAVPAPQTMITPPTPRMNLPHVFSSPDVTESPASIKSNEFNSSGIIVSPSGNMISHRRVRSASAASHKPSKLSNSISALGPTMEETKAGSRSPSGAQSGFFSSVFSAAQNAASTLTNTLNSQPKVRSPTSSGSLQREEPQATESERDLPDLPATEEKKPLAVDTLGSGDLNFEHLDIALPPGGSVSTPDGVVITKPDLPVDKRKNQAVNRRDDEAARQEDRHAARAVTMAYEKPSDISLLPPSDESLELQSTTSLPIDAGDHTPPAGSVVEGDIGTRPYRSGSVRSRLAARRHRGSSGATTSTIGAIGASAIALGVPGANSSMPRLTGFAVASKKRNRDFHQLFRSVPEDDYLIEDYSCALQREIILAGRIYISEGHICFSSNILGWVTTLVISFDEIVAIEKESTAMVFPNAIAIQTLHARHTFRSLLSREATYDLMVNIWKINHPSLKSSVNGTRVTHGTGDKTEKAGENDSDCEDEDEIYDEDEDEDNADSFYEPDASVNGSDRSLPTRGLSRQPSGQVLAANGVSAPTGNSNGDVKGGKSNGEKDVDFPGPPTHPPTEYNDPAGQYDKVIKDETIPAPLGKVYSYVFGPASGSFIPKFLVENQKSGELQFESEKGGLTNESRTRKYSYIKPLPGGIGPKQTKCISTEYLDFLDLEKAVLVTLSTQTPDVPSGNVFCTKTKYLFTWAQNNQTRFFMTCTIEWSGKSWLKGPIEKGAIDGQTAFGTELISSLKAAMVPRGRGAGKGGKAKGRRKKGDSVGKEANAAGAQVNHSADAQKTESWGLLEPLHGLLGPVTGVLGPLWSGNFAVLVIGVLLFMVLFRSPSQPSLLSGDIGCPGYTLPQRLAAYEEMWRREESELWGWLEDRVGMDGIAFPTVQRPVERRQQKNSRRLQGEREIMDKLADEKMSAREMDHAIRTTRERLDTLEQILTRRTSQYSGSEQDAIHAEL
ncbi:hypothetical protein BDV59DRAFT_185287 [Aspergillus ambiguus]|uniref:GRAM and VASt domain-containing protein n=1 Tax=Aspergillus ambiguus TaxID=176160 RepID=UPI003CCD5516